MKEELAIELMKSAWNFNITAIILVTILGGFLILWSAFIVREFGDGIITRGLSYGLTIGSLIFFGASCYFAFGGFYI